jgi:hypothetical protein
MAVPTAIANNRTASSGLVRRLTPNAGSSTLTPSRKADFKRRTSVAKKTRIWISPTQATPAGRKILDELKSAVRNVLRSYVKLRAAQKEFDTQMERLDDAAYKSTIPRPYLK